MPVIWVTNRIEQIDPAFRRRFQYHLELKSPPPGAREALVARALAGVDGGARASPPGWPSASGLTPAQIRTAVKFARLAGGAEGDASVEALIERQLGNADKALGNSPQERGARRVVTPYDLTWCNTESRFEIPKIVEALRRKGYGTLCFYGPPGTGKTALAEHIAQALQRPLMIRQASDIVSKYVGETEQNMANMFEEAADRGGGAAARRGRQLPAQPPHGRAQLRGQRGQRDAAGHGALRRHLHLHHQPVRGPRRGGAAPLHLQDPVQAADRPEQRERMFVAEALGGDAARLTGEQRARLRQLEALAPGDFASVKRQVDVLGEAFEPDEFLSQLEAEHRVKPEVRQQRGIGFLH